MLKSQAAELTVFYDLKFNAYNLKTTSSPWGSRLCWIVYDNSSYTDRIGYESKKTSIKKHDFWKAAK